MILYKGRKKPMKILIPPSEGKNTNINTNIIYSNIRSKNTFYFLEEHRDLIFRYLENMNKLKKSEIEKILSVKGENLDIALKSNMNIKNSECIRSKELYTGTMFKYIDYKNFNVKQTDFYDENVIIFSGLFGLLSPKDFIPNYKLKSNTTLPNFKKIDIYWKNIITNYLISLQKKELIIDLLTNTHRNMYDQKKCNTFKIDFYEQKNNIIKKSGHNSKKYRGIFINEIIKNKVSSFTELKKISIDNLYFLDEKSDESKNYSYLIKEK
jgi:hypothetical protein